MSAAVVIRSPRWTRLLTALAAGRRLSSVDVARLAGCADPHALIHDVRRRLGLQIVPAFTTLPDRDGRLCRVGLYSLTAAERRRVHKLLSESGTKP